VGRGTLTFDIPVMIVVALVCLPVSFTGRMISRWEGGLFLAYYGAFTLYLILSATGKAILRTYTHVMTLFVISITVLVLSSFLLREWRARSLHRDR